MAQEKITREIINEEVYYFKTNDKNEIVAREDCDKIFKQRVYGVKTLQSYIQEIEDCRAKNYHVEEVYTRNGEVVALDKLVSGSGLTSMLALLSKEVKNATITRKKEVLTGGIFKSYRVKFEIELF